MSKYDDILYHPRPVSKRHAPLSMEDRAAQFSPFAALTGFDQVIDHTAQEVLDRTQRPQGEAGEDAI